MFRLRRYRTFLIVAVLTTISVYHLTHVRNWEVPNLDTLKDFTHPLGPKAPNLPLPPPTSLPQALLPTTQSSTSSTTSSTVSSTSSSSSSSLPALLKSASLTTPPTDALPTQRKSRPIETDEDRAALAPGLAQEFGQHGQGRLEVEPRPKGLEVPHWTSQSQYFAVPTESLINLPTGEPKKLPPIQHVFDEQSATAKADSLKKANTIKEAFRHAWSGYKDFAIPHDELKPVTGGSSDPFNGWGATLVDSLDSLWIMGFKEEFEEAVTFVSKIDFTTTARKDVPLFETTIRYLGGLIAAYDLTSGKYEVLLEKAVQLAEVMMGAFDTPNRMPVTYYYWTPSYASQPHRAGTRVVLAELGSLSVEFTRLAQITREQKFYDAVARITNALKEFQMQTTMPGLWPLEVDASGCKKPEISGLQGLGSSSGSLTHNMEWEPDSKYGSVQISTPVRGDQLDAKSPNTLVKRQADDAGLTIDPAALAESHEDSQAAEAAKIHTTTADDVDCEFQQLAVPPYALRNSYAIGGMADSTYEYLPKEHLLLGGLAEEYQSMYENAADVIRKELLYRPMTKEERDILFVAKVDISAPYSGTGLTMEKYYEGTHLSCFAGGMFALGSKVFGIESDMELARKLTDGCVWAYESTETGIMPEEFYLVPCENRDSCPWSETRWHDHLDPDWEFRIEQENNFIQRQKEAYYQSLRDAAVDDDDRAAVGTEVNSATEAGAGAAEAVGKASGMTKRQAPNTVVGESTGDANSPTVPEPSKTEDLPLLPQPDIPVFQPRPVLSHQEFAEARIRDERLPAGYSSIRSRKYILRPEAIESVFIMYRTTGDEYWRKKGWNMFMTIQSYTMTDIANSAISDVTASTPLFTDTMESFWLAETLKYFYLLFSDPETISLDDYIFNTEAHPFKRPTGSSLR